MKLWVARDNNGELWTYNHKPIKKGGIFTSNIHLTSNLFSYVLPTWALPEVTFENSPQEVELVIKK